uniref:Uncharacterized protein n=1 Tax=Leersia perrieri TaxID=77586 RepID=A0A0D9X6V9_9ORYZ
MEAVPFVVHCPPRANQLRRRLLVDRDDLPSKPRPVKSLARVNPRLPLRLRPPLVIDRFLCIRTNPSPPVVDPRRRHRLDPVDVIQPQGEHH